MAGYTSSSDPSLLVDVVEAAMRPQRGAPPGGVRCGRSGRPLRVSPTRRRARSVEQLGRAGPEADHHHLGEVRAEQRPWPGGHGGGGHGPQPVVVVGPGTGPTVVGGAPPPDVEPPAPPDPAPVFGVRVTPACWCPGAAPGP